MQPQQLRNQAGPRRKLRRPNCACARQTPSIVVALHSTSRQLYRSHARAPMDSAPTFASLGLRLPVATVTAPAAGRRAVTTTTAAAAVPPSGSAGASGGGVSPPPAEIEATCLRCVISAISGAIADDISDVLLSLGAQSVVVQEHRPEGAPEQEIFDDGVSKLWDVCDIVAHFPLEADVDSCLALLEDAMREAAMLQPDSAGLVYTTSPVANESWVEQIKASYVPLQITQDMWIIPEWSEPLDLTATNITLQPGVAFGTGEHPTTRMCLRELRVLADAGRLRRASVCDYGTGSGVLAIAALKYGAASAVGTDIDLLAVKAAQRNGALNGYEPPAFTALQCGAGIDDPEPIAAAAAAASGSSSGSGSSSSTATTPTFDLVVANILRGPLVELQGRLSGYVKPGGLLMLSGILYEQAAEIQAAYGGDFQDFVVKTDQQWAVITAVKKRR
ncbi:hypothetical protein HYH02_012314 [Chlamydomonas schloesseri]|uniref:ETFB lysine methyltransferase n=1 Tax=Chlamydomonas schloesseri TaxID=2026947 RepID=A0A835W095_9CHLO|nr:hypothetical protein HYH02_012314 [Chlamydomonas schloesseri]|eukprot:KAG2434485.1 hypothetical protein HYH02_012314 [Chlamydomonas schloesseri]